MRVPRAAGRPRGSVSSNPPERAPPEWRSRSADCLRGSAPPIRSRPMPEPQLTVDRGGLISSASDDVTASISRRRITDAHRPLGAAEFKSVRGCARAARSARGSSTRSTAARCPRASRNPGQNPARRPAHAQSNGQLDRLACMGVHARVHPPAPAPARVPRHPRVESMDSILVGHHADRSDRSKERPDARRSSKPTAILELCSSPERLSDRSPLRVYRRGSLRAGPASSQSTDQRAGVTSRRNRSAFSAVCAKILPLRMESVRAPARRRAGLHGATASAVRDRAIVDGSCSPSAHRASKEAEKPRSSSDAPWPRERRERVPARAAPAPAVPAPATVPRAAWRARSCAEFPR